MGGETWHEIILSLKLTSPVPRHPLTSGEALVKSIHRRAGLLETVTATFAWSTPRLRRSQPNLWTVRLFGADEEQARTWYDVACTFFAPRGGARNFALEHIEEPQRKVLSSPPPSPEGEEVCLYFDTPLPFRPKTGHPRHWLEAERFVQAIRARWMRLFGHTPTLPDPPLHVLPHYWSYREITHPSASQKGHTQYLNGCTGPLYLRAHDADHLAAWWPWLWHASVLGVGGRVSFGLGRCRLIIPTPPWFASRLCQPELVARAVDQVIERHDDARAALVEAALASPQATETVVSRVLEYIKEGGEPGPFQVFEIPKPQGGVRLIEKPEAIDLVVLTHLNHLLAPVLDASLGPESIGFRKGLSRESAIERIHTALAEGFDTVVEADIAHCFDAIPHEPLWRCLDAHLPRADGLVRAVLWRYLKAPRRIHGQVLPRECGLPQGSPLSPLLANLYLNAFDRRIRALENVRLIRYADDFVILTRGQEDAEATLLQVEDTLKTLGLELHLDKTHVHAVSEGFVFLGIRFGADSGATEDLSLPAVPWRKPLYVTEPFAFLGLDGEALEVRRDHRVLQRFPLKRIAEILLLAPCITSSALLTRCAQAGIPVVLTSGNGHHVATFACDDRERFAIAHRHAQAYEALGEKGRLAIARRLVAAKIGNALHLIQRRYQAGLADTVAALEALQTRTAAAQDLDTLRGLEGSAARHAFAMFGQWIHEEGFEWQGRRRRPADRLNSLLNFGYHLLFVRLNVLIRAAGLNPYLGLLHEPNDRYETFVADIQELFRAYVDRLVVRVVNLRQIRAEHFRVNEAGHWLTAEGRQRFLEAFARELEHRPAPDALTFAEALHWQVDQFRRHFLENAPLVLYHW